MINLRPYRDYDEKDVLNFASFSGVLPAYRGTLVKIQQGFVATDEPIEMLGAVGASYNNTVSQRYGAYAKIAATTAGEAPLGILLFDVRETDENGELLKFNPRKAMEMDVMLSGQAVPVCTKGTFLYSGTVLGAQTPVPHTKLYAGVSGELTTGQAWGALGSGAITGITSPCVGFCLGGKDTTNAVMVRLDCTAGL
jgi:hypothetical protein